MPIWWLLYFIYFIFFFLKLVPEMLTNITLDNSFIPRQRMVVGYCGFMLDISMSVLSCTFVHLYFVSG